MEKLEDFCFVRSYLQTQSCGEGSFGGVDAQAFAFGREPNIQIVKFGD
jgi:hypothetical protein